MRVLEEGGRFGHKKWSNIVSSKILYGDGILLEVLWASFSNWMIRC
jgi:hypothetical protein